MRKKVAAVMVRISWQVLSISGIKWVQSMIDVGVVTQDFKRKVGAARAEEMAELARFKSKLRELGAVVPNLLYLLHGPDYADSGRIDECGGLAPIAPAAVTIQEVTGTQTPSAATPA